MIIDDPNKNIVCNLNWKQHLFDFDARYHDLNLIFVFDSNAKTFLTSDIFIKAATIVNDKYLRYIKNFNINAFFTHWFVSKKNGDGVIIGNYEDYQKLPTNTNYLMLQRTLCSPRCNFTCLKEFKNGTFINKSQHFRTITILPHYLVQLRRIF